MTEVKKRAHIFAAQTDSEIDRLRQNLFDQPIGRASGSAKLAVPPFEFEPVRC